MECIFILSISYTQHMCLYAHANAIEFCLVSWPDEGTVSVVPRSAD